MNSLTDENGLERQYNKRCGYSDVLECNWTRDKHEINDEDSGECHQKAHKQHEHFLHVMI